MGKDINIRDYCLKSTWDFIIKMSKLKQNKIKEEIIMKVKVKCDDCGLVFKVPPTPNKSNLYGDDIYLDNNCPRCDCQNLKTVRNDFINKLE